MKARPQTSTSYPNDMYNAYRNERYFLRLDGLRAVSILLVVLFHTDEQFFAGRHLWIWLSGNLGVPVFFVVSGYLITTLCLREEDVRGSVRLRSFYVRRCFRILPLYYSVLALYCFLIFGLAYDHKQAMLLSRLPYLLSYLNEFANGGPFSQSWSLAIEEKFYVVWPVLCFVLVRSTQQARLLVASIAELIPLAILTLGGTRALTPMSATVIVSYSQLMAGCILALCMHTPSTFRRCSGICDVRRGRLLMLTLLPVHVGAYYVREAGNSVLYGWYLVAYAWLISLLAITVLLGKDPLLDILAARPLVWLGRRSYGIYLIHLLALKAARRLCPPLPQARLESVILFLYRACGVDSNCGCYAPFY